MPTCPACSTDIPNGFAFCGRCGARLADASVSATEERRVVTVLFCDLAGFTARSDGADPEDVRALLRPYHARLRHEIERHGGTLDKFIGDGVMAVFGAPVAHEDDPERAVRTALAMLAAVDELNERHPTLDLKVRIGITTGEAVVALDDRGDSERVVGDVVNTASRLEGVAPVGGVVVGQPTFQLTSKIFNYQSLPPVQVKGKAKPLPIWRAHAARSRRGIDVDHAPTVVLVGREIELTLLTSVYERALAEGSVQLVTIVGEPGVGKTRLVRELRAIVDARPELVAWRQGRCLAYGEETSFWALGEVVKAQAGILASDNTAEAASKLGDAVAAVVEDQAEQEWLMTRLTPLVGLTSLDGPLSQPPEQEEAFAAWRRLLEAIAAQRPLVMVLEDLHWADPALLAFAMHLVEWAAPVPMLIVCTARPEFYGSAPDWGGGLHNATTIALRPLSDVDTARLVAALLEQVVLPATLQARLLEQAGGNPLYAEEVCRLLAERGGLAREGRTLKLPMDPELALPDSLGALIAARLDTVDPEYRALLEDAAIVGTVFWAGALAAMGGRDPARVRLGLHELVRRDFIRRARNSSVAGEVEYAFWHVLTRDAAYARLPRAARARKHASAAAWIEQTAGERVADQAEVLAHHYETALQLARAADATEQIATYQASARHFVVLAGDRMMALDATRADAYYLRALRLMPPGDPQQAQVLAKAAQAAHHAGRLADADRAYEEAIASFRAGGDLRGAGTAEILRSDLLWFRGEPGRSRDACATAIELLEREPPSVATAIAYAEMVAKLVFMGRPTAAVEWADKAIALARQIGADEARQWALQQRGLARCDLGDWDGIDDLRHAVELGLQLGLGRRSAMAYSNLADRVRLTEGPAAALTTFRAGLDLCRQRGIVDIGTFCQADLLQCLFDLGDWDELVETADEVIAWSDAQGGSYAIVLAESRKARVLAWRGEVAPASSLIGKALPRAREIADPQILGCAFPVAALIEHRQGNSIAAVRLVKELEQGIKDSPATYRASPLPDLVRVCLAAGELVLARRLLDGLDVRATGLHHCLTTARALLAEAQGDLKPAADLHAQAATGWSNYGSVPEHGQALLGLGRCLALLQDPQARDRLREARAIFARLGARPLVSESDEWLQRSLPPAVDATG
jgi:class 3 adenylate cyclase/tetratricopeptide (TPR) repeat protein